MKYSTLLFAVAAFLSLRISDAAAGTSSIMIDAKTGNVLYSENADVRRYPASLTKMMTLYLTFSALENGTLKLDDHLKISRTAANRSPSRLGLIPGKTIDVKTAILATIIKSANDCATVLGEALAKDEASFAVLMTETAHKLGMKDTTFKNASGLQHSEQKTTARDMAVLGAALYHHFPQYYSWFSIKQFEYEGKTIVSHNNPLKEFEGADGMKTGFTSAAGYNIVTSAKRGNHRVIAVTMGHDQVKERDNKIYAMMGKAFSAFETGKQVNIKQLRADINRVPSVKAEKHYAQVEKYISNSSSPRGDWAIQAGAFAEYGKAKTQAQKIQKKLAGKFGKPSINVEKFSKNGTSMYRSQLAGFSKTDATKACQILKNSGQGCMVRALGNNNASYAQK